MYRDTCGEFCIFISGVTTCTNDIELGAVYIFYQRLIFLVPFINSCPFEAQARIVSSVYCWQLDYQMHAPPCMSYYYAAPTRDSLGFVICYVHRSTCLYEVMCTGWKSAGLPWYWWAGWLPPEALCPARLPHQPYPNHGPVYTQVQLT
jgi:hypothetical protein